MSHCTCNKEKFRSSDGEFERILRAFPPLAITIVHSRRGQRLAPRRGLAGVEGVLLRVVVLPVDTHALAPAEVFVPAPQKFSDWQLPRATATCYKRKGTLPKHIQQSIYNNLEIAIQKHS